MEIFIIRNDTRETYVHQQKGYNVERKYSSSETLQGRMQMFIRNVTRQSGTVHHQKRYKGDRHRLHQKRYKGDTFIIRIVTRENANVHQKRYKGEWKRE